MPSITHWPETETVEICSRLQHETQLSLLWHGNNTKTLSFDPDNSWSLSMNIHIHFPIMGTNNMQAAESY